MSNQAYSRNTSDFARLRQFVKVRFKQGVPLVDADLNEADDLRRYELRSFLRWFVGEGVPVGNNGFQIIPAPDDPTDVTIRGGDGTITGAGRCIVDGMEVFNLADVRFGLQEFADATRAAAAGVPPVTVPSVPAAGDPERVDLYYLDVWEREITAEEESQIMDSRIGIETSRRLRREWAVRAVEESVGIPANGTPPNHVYYLLARVRRFPGETSIQPDAIEDLRRIGVTLQSQADYMRLAEDAFGPTYNPVTPDLAYHLRGVVNGILRSGRPAIVGPDQAVAVNGPHSFTDTTVDANGNQWIFWVRPLDTQAEIWYTRQSDGLNWLPPQRLQTVNNTSTGVAVVGTANGSVWAFWQDLSQLNIFGQVYDGSAWGSIIDVSERGANPAIFNTNLAAASTDNEVMVIWVQNNARFLSRRYTNSPAGVQPIAEISTSFRAAPAIVVTGAGTYVAYGSAAVNTSGGPANILRSTWNRATTSWEAPQDTGVQITTGAVEFAALVDRFNASWLFFSNGQASITANRQSGTLSETMILAETSGINPRLPSAGHDAFGNGQVLYVPSAGEQAIYRLNLITAV